MMGVNDGSMIAELFRLFGDDTGGGGLGAASPLAIYGDSAVGADGLPVFVLDQESPAGEVDGIVCVVNDGFGDTGPQGPFRIDILQDGLYNFLVQGDLFGAALTGGSVLLAPNLGPGMPGVAQKYNEGAVHPDDTEYAAVWSEIYPMKAGGWVTVSLDESGTASSRVAALIVTKLS